MSSRALRKAQKAREDHEAVNVEESEEDETPSGTGAKHSLFAILTEQDPNDGREEEGSSAPIMTLTVTHDQSTGDDHANDDTNQFHKPAKPSSSVLRKKKKKTKGRSTTNTGTVINAELQLDEIDTALKALNTPGHGNAPEAAPSSVDSATAVVCQLLSIDSHHLQVGNEMRRLFGRAAIDADHEDDEARTPAARRHIAQGDHGGLAEAVSGRNAHGGPGLAAMLRRRNIFVPGKEEWPRAAGGGLNMEIVEKNAGGIVEYRFVHNQVYQGAQRYFSTCVMSMDPTLMITMLRFNPYHISTLLQVSEIAKQERDHATSGDLLERALFSFGRAVHSTFPAALAQGKARLDFKRPENREFWLAVWRYIGNIGMRATWRTAYEWARLLLSLSPDEDPYCVRLVIDQLAIRARQAQSFLDLSCSKFYVDRWTGLPNISYSQSLAFNMVGDLSRARYALHRSIELFPWVAARLLQVLNIEKTFPAIWGKTARSSVDALHSELYVTLGQDLWKTPEASKFLTTTILDVQATAPSSNRSEISVNEARHVILTDKPALIGLLPHSITSKVDSMADPLPPADNLQSYETRVNREFLGLRESWYTNSTTLQPPSEMIREQPREFVAELHALQTFFEELIPGFSQPADRSSEGRAGDENQLRPTDGSSGQPTRMEHTSEEPITGEVSPVDAVRAGEEFGPLDVFDEAVERALARSNISIREMRGRLMRLVALREALVRQPGQRVASDEGDEVVMTESGLTRVTFRPRENHLDDSDLPYGRDLDFRGLTIAEDAILQRTEEEARPADRL